MILSANLFKHVGFVIVLCVNFLLAIAHAQTDLEQNQAVTDASAGHKMDAQTLTFGIVPQQSAKRLAATWGPIIQELGEKSGYNIRFATAPSIPEFEKRLLAKTYDIAYMNPYHYTVYSQQAGYRVIAKQKDKGIKGIIVVRKDASTNTLSDLANQTLAFPAPLAFAATLIPQANFKNQGIAIDSQFVKSHDSVYMGVAKGFFPAGGGVMRTLNAAPQNIREQLRILWTSDTYTPHAIALAPHINEKTATNISQSLLAITDEVKLQRIAFSGFEPAIDAQWDSIRELKINVIAQPTQ